MERKNKLGHLFGTQVKPEGQRPNHNKEGEEADRLRAIISAYLSPYRQNQLWGLASQQNLSHHLLTKTTEMEILGKRGTGIWPRNQFGGESNGGRGKS